MKMAIPLPLLTKRRLVSGGAFTAVIVLGIISRTAALVWPLYDKSLGWVGVLTWRIPCRSVCS